MPTSADLIRARIRRKSGLVQQRRLAAFLVTVLGGIVIGVVTLIPQSAEGGVLGATGTPASVESEAPAGSPAAPSEHPAESGTTR